MSCECCRIHERLQKLPRYGFPYSRENVARNGIYLLFERSESGHNGERIVRVGTHTGQNNLASRISEHFLVENKDRSIFRKNIGRAILHKRRDPFLTSWDICLTSKKAREEYGKTIDLEYQKSVEQEVSEYIQHNFSFCVVGGVKSKAERLFLESALVSTISLCSVCGPSTNWLGSNSPKGKIAKSGMWQVVGLYKQPFDSEGCDAFLGQLSN